MMKSVKALKWLAAATAATTIGVLGNLTPMRAADFDAVEVNESSIISVAIPGGSLIPYKLLLARETQPGANCFSVSGSNPGIVEPLWQVNSGCGVGFDSNAYSIRVQGEELRGQYSLVVEERNGELVLVGKPLRGRSFVIGRTGGIVPGGFMEIDLDPGWRITQRSFEGSRLSHFYYTNDASLASLLENGPIVTDPTPPPTQPPTTPDYPFPDIQRDIYAAEITAAFNLGIVAGGTDGNFEPLRPVTREEAASIVVEALKTRGFTFPETTSRAPFPDVPANRWSAAKISALASRGILAGDPSGFFRPTDTVTRAEVMSMLRRASEQIVAAGSQDVRSAQLTPTGDVFNFSDTSGHWNEQTIDMMSAYCNIATPYNERGTAFQPNAASLRNYTTAATFRMVDCGATPLP
jgi:N-acetylmuramoyl-L-alanine amidase